MHRMTQMLDGLDVIELSAFVAVPLAGMTLAQLGATVTRIDPVGGGIDIQRWPLTADGVSLYWTALNKGKQSMAVDLRSERGRGLVTDLIAAPGRDGGVVITNLPYSWLDYEELARRRPDLIMVVVRGDRDGSAAVDYTVNAAVGYPYATGTGDEPVNHVLPAWDVIAGNQVALSVLAAERHRTRTGEGNFMTIALTDVALATVGNLGHIAEATVNAADRPADGNHLYGAFGRDFETADGRHVEVVAMTRRQWQALLDATDSHQPLAHLAAETAADLESSQGDRFRVRHEIATILEPWFLARTLAEVGESLDAHGVLWGPYQTFRQLVSEDPRASEANPLFSMIDQPGVGPVLVPGPVADSTAVPRRRPNPAPELGAHTRQILSERLDLDTDAIEGLHRDGII
jgi:2-methylfumaryl-CoA isomerase